MEEERKKQEIKNFKKLLERYVVYLEFLQRKKDDFKGSGNYSGETGDNSDTHENTWEEIKGLLPTFTAKKQKPQQYYPRGGKGHQGSPIQKVISGVDIYECGKICFSVENHYGNGFANDANLLHWLTSDLNIYACWNDKKDKIERLKVSISSQAEKEAGEFLERYTQNEYDKSNPPSYSVSDLRLFEDGESDKLKEMYEKFTKWFEKYKPYIKSRQLDEATKLLEENYNLILTGAPGTGKTFMANNIAAKMIFMNKPLDFAEYDDWNEKERKTFDKQVKFVQFHPSYDYTDFVEGLRPYEKGDEIGFRRQDGAFKKFCKEALKEWKNCYQKILKLINGKSIQKDQIDKIVNSITKKGDEFELGSVSLPENDGNNYAEISKSIQKVADLATKKFAPKYVFIIDEINRGELNKILGELFYSIDPGYRGKKAKKIDTQYQNLVDYELNENIKKTQDEDAFKEGFYVPDNVYIIGTMNDIDRSVESMDFAIRRRFAWKEVIAEETVTMLDSIKFNGEDKYLVIETMNRLNEKIEKVFDSKSYQIGASYYMKIEKYLSNGKKVDDNSWKKLWRYHIEGILLEYLRGRNDAKTLMKEFKEIFFGKPADEEVEFEDSVTE